MCSLPGNRQHEPSTFQSSGTCTFLSPGLSKSIVFAQESLQRLQQRVRDHFPLSSPPGPVANFDDFPLLGVKPLVSVSERRRPASSNDMPFSETLPLLDFHPLHQLEGTSPSNETATTSSSKIGCLPNLSIGPNSHARFLQDDANDAIPLQLLSDIQDFQPSLHFSGVSCLPLDGTMGGHSGTEAGKWGQFLDQLGVW